MLEKGMSQSNSTDSEKLLEASVNEGMLGDEYELIGVYNEEPDEDQGFEYEIFIVSVGTAV